MTSAANNMESGINRQEKHSFNINEGVKATSKLAQDLPKQDISRSKMHSSSLRKKRKDKHKSHSKKKKHRKRSRTRSSSSSSNSLDDVEHSDLTKVRKKRKHRHKNKKRKHFEAHAWKAKKRKPDEELSNNDQNISAELSSINENASKRLLGPVTKEDYEKQQSVIRRVYDEDTKRHRLVRGSGEIIEEIVSKERHKQINQQATKGDGMSFQINLQQFK